MQNLIENKLYTVNKKILLIAFLCLSAIASFAQIIKEKTVDNGGSGSYKAIVTTEETLQEFVVYRPENMKEAVKKGGTLPLIAFANGGCNNTSITHEKVLSEIASHGYIVIALGPMQMSLDDRKIEKAETSMMIEAIDWATSQNKNKKSNFYKKIDIDKVAVGGKSCGGAQVLVVANDPRIKTYLMYNTGIGDMTMADASKELLKNFHGSIVYIVGGESDVAYNNALLDYDRINSVPVALANLVEGGHMGTFAEEFGGSFAKMVIDWLDWQLKGNEEKSQIFLEKDLSSYPGWTMDAKNFNK